MANNSKVKLIIGFSFITAAFLCVAAIAYMMGQSGRAAALRQADLQVQLANLIAEKSENKMQKSDAERIKREPFNMEDFLAHAESVYGEKEKSRKEGVLWIDRQASSLLVTLGAVNGLKKDSRLTVYDGDNEIGEVVVATPFDIISYVQAAGKSAGDFSKDYYRVSAAALP